MADGGSMQLNFRPELVVDLFAGGGGASLGISRAYRAPDVAVNHNPIAIAVHEANHPETRHFTCDVFEVDPVEATGGQPVALLWASPDCRHHSKAKGGKPRSKKIRGLAWVVVKWAAACKPRLIHLENVEEFADWGPLTPDGKPCQARRGMTFRRWVRQLERLGYTVDWRELIAADYGAPTIRKRLYVIARCDGRPIVWPKPTHSKSGAGGLPRWRAAAECIDWSLPSKSIFGRERPLATNTCRRIAKGLWRYVLTAAEPFVVHGGGCSGEPAQREVCDIVRRQEGPGRDGCGSTGRQIDAAAAPAPAGHRAARAKRAVSGCLVAAGHGEGTTGRFSHGIKACSDPLNTVVASGGEHALMKAYLVPLTQQGGPWANDRHGPLRTAHGPHRGEQTIVQAFLDQANGGFYDGDGRAVTGPMSTILQAGSHQRLVTAYLVKYYGEGGQWQGAAEPMHTVPTKDRMGLVQVTQVPADLLAPELVDRARACAAFLHEHLPEHFTEPADLVLVGGFVLVDITLRMLAPRELARAQGFSDDYVIERGADGTPITKTDQVRLIGNSVCPDVAEALVRANSADLIAHYEMAAA